MSAVTEEESWKREMPRRSSAQHRSSAHRPKEGGTRQTAKPNANQCHSPVRAEVRGDLKRLPRTFFTPPLSPFPPSTARGLQSGQAYLSRLYTFATCTQRTRGGIYIYIYVYAVLRVRPLRHGIHSSLPSACTHYSRRTCTKYSCTRAHSAREIAYACDLRVQIYTRVIIYICATHENSFPSPLLFSKGQGVRFIKP